MTESFDPRLYRIFPLLHGHYGPGPHKQVFLAVGKGMLFSQGRMKPGNLCEWHGIIWR
jgi:hypothetical protein